MNLQLNGSIRPVPPPRDHLRMEKDGRMVNRAPAPQVPDRNPALQSHQIAQIVDATPEQLDSIKKYQVSNQNTYRIFFFIFIRIEFSATDKNVQQNFMVVLTFKKCDYDRIVHTLTTFTVKIEYFTL